MTVYRHGTLDYRHVGETGGGKRTSYYTAISFATVENEDSESVTFTATTSSPRYAEGNAAPILYNPVDPTAHPARVCPGGRCSLVWGITGDGGRAPLV
jgi:hypothetical protein